ncbi:hypothetical protein JNG39_13915 [Luteibacter sp. CQ10]
MDKGQKMDDLKPFVRDGSRILESMTGDLTGSGRSDTVLVIDPPGVSEGKLGEGPARTVLLLVRAVGGGLRLASANAHVVPCATCGGVAGDPFGYIKIEHGAFTIVNGGGSRERWSDAYTFTYASERRDWIVTRVVRKVTDTESGAEKHIELGPEELGSTSFHDFDPAKVPEVNLP